MTTASRSASLTTVATLVRLPNLFTAPPDILLGAALVAVAGYTVPHQPLVGLCVSSMLLYAAGTTFNDYFDAGLDAEERPDRPIPSGAISRARAGILGIALLTGGIAAAIAAVGIAGGTVAAAIAATVLLYDGFFNGTALGFIVMGTTRGLNVVLGTTVTGLVPTIYPRWLLAIPLLILLYIAGVTHMAEGETGKASHRSVLVGVTGVALASVGGVAFLAFQSPEAILWAIGLGFIAAFVVWTGRPLWRAYSNPTPELIGPAIGACVLGLPLLNAAYASSAGWPWALAIIGFLVPAIGLSRIFDVT